MTKFIRILVLSLFLLFASALPAYAQAPWNQPCVAQPGDTGGFGFNDIPTLSGVECAFSNVVSIAFGLAGIILFIMFVTGGFKYLTAGGDAKAIEAAKGTITHAIAGLVLLVFAYLILLLIANITGVTDITIFRIYKQ